MRDNEKNPVLNENPQTPFPFLQERITSQQLQFHQVQNQDACNHSLYRVRAK